MEVECQSVFSGWWLATHENDSWIVKFSHKSMYVCTLLQEYGITRDEKLLIGQCICTPLLRKILADFQRNAEEEEESTRLDSRCESGVDLSAPQLAYEFYRRI